jgi:hypothetical protein
MIELGVLQQPHGTYCREGVVPDDWLDVVVKVDNVGFPEA